MRALKTQEEIDDASSIDWRDLPGFAEVHDYWQSLRQGNDLPRAEDVDLLALIPWLPELSLLDMVAPDEMICRFAGTAIAERLGHDLTGKNIYFQQSVAMRDRARNAYEKMAQQPCGMLARYTNHYNTGFQGSVCSFYLPLLVAANGSTRLLGIGNREEKADYAQPIEESIIATDVASVTWLDIGLGTPEKEG